MKEEFSNLDCEPVFHVEVEWLQNKKNSFYVERVKLFFILFSLLNLILCFNSVSSNGNYLQTNSCNGKY